MKSPSGKLPPVRIGVVGARNIGKNHIRHALNTDGANVIAVADTDPARLKSAGEEFGITHLFSSADQLLERDDIDAVVLAVPNHVHAPAAIAALRAGKHVLVEKPIALTTAEADEMIAARDASGKTLMVGMHVRLTPANSTIKAALDSGLIGRLISTQTGWIESRPKPSFWERGDWALTRQAGGGPLLDVGIHRLDLALYFLGFPEVDYVCGQCFYGIGSEEGKAIGKTYEVEDGAFGYVRFRNGTVLTLEASCFQNTATTGNFTRITGELGCMTTPSETPLLGFRDGGFAPLPYQPDPNAPGSCARHFVRVLQGEEKLIPTAEQAREGLRIIEAIYQSSDSGKPVFFPTAHSQP